MILLLGEEPLVNGDSAGDQTALEKISPGTSVGSTASTTTNNTCSHIPNKVAVDPSFSYLCPQPQHIQQFEGLFFVPPTEMTIQVIAPKGKQYIAKLIL